MKFEEILIEIMVLEPESGIDEFMKRKRGKFRFPMYINEKLNNTDINELKLSVRANNCLEAAGYTTVGKLVEKINKREDLKNLRNCGEKTMDEIRRVLVKQLNQKFNYFTASVRRGYQYNSTCAY